MLNNVVLDHQGRAWVSRLKLTALATLRCTDAVRRQIFGDVRREERHYSVLGHPQYVHGLFTMLWRELGGIFTAAVRDAETPAGARLLAHQTPDAPPNRARRRQIQQ